MKPTSSVATTNVHPSSSRRRADHATVRAQFESWLTEIAQDIDKERGERLRELLDRSLLTQRKLADAVGVESRTVQRWLRGSGIAAENREPLAAALGRPVAYIMHGELEGPDPHDILGRLDRIETLLERVADRLSQLETDARELLSLAHEQALDEEAELGDLPSDAAEEDEDEPGAQAG